MRKEFFEHASDTATDPQGPWGDLNAFARALPTSEDPAHPIESALLPGSERGWRAAHPGPQTIWLHFDVPQSIHEIYLRFEADEERTHEFVLLASRDGGVSYREIVRQQFNFSPGGATTEEENYTPNLAGVTDLKLTIIPDLAGRDVKASLRAFHLR